VREAGKKGKESRTDFQRRPFVCNKQKKPCHVVNDNQRYDDDDDGDNDRAPRLIQFALRVVVVVRET
jgi:hypothetical protein